MKIFTIIVILLLLYIIYIIIRLYIRRSIRDQLSKSFKALNSIDVDYFIAYGTLLGYHRENDVIYGDNDGDIIINGSDNNIDKLLSINWGEYGLKIHSYGFYQKNYITTPDRKNVSMYRVHYKNRKFFNIFIDFYVADIVNDKINIRTKDDYCYEINYDIIYPTKEVIFLNNKCKVPNNINKLLILYYGEDYMTPKSGFKSKKCNRSDWFKKYSYNKDVFAEDLNNLRLYNVSLKPSLFTSKIIHQTWKTDNLTPEQIRIQSTWKKNYPDWNYMLWTDDMIDNFVNSRFSWFLPIWNKLTPFIEKVDCVRYMWMYEYGGIYADLDLVCKQSIEELILWNCAYIPVENTNINWSFNRDKASPAFLISNTGNKIWLYMLLYITNNYHKDVIRATGPVALANVIKHIYDKNIIVDIAFISEESVGIGGSIFGKNQGKYSYHINTGNWEDNKYEIKHDDKDINNIKEVSKYIHQMLE